MGSALSGIKREVKGVRLSGLKLSDDMLFAKEIASIVVLNLEAKLDNASPSSVEQYHKSYHL